jgi:hypothetical protein
MPACAWQPGLLSLVQGDINAPLLTGFHAKLLSIAAGDEHSYLGDPMTEVVSLFSTLLNLIVSLSL